MSTPENIRNKAYSAARQLVRNRLAESAGAEYEKLGPTEKIGVDRAVEKKQDHIKKIALKLIPKIASSEKNRRNSFNSGSPLSNNGSPEKGDVHEALNKKFSKLTSKKAPEKPSEDKKGKSTHIIMHNSFGEEVALNSAVYKALLNKAEKADIDITIIGEIYNRGMSVWYEDTNVSQQQYAFARVNSFINKGKTYFNEDYDLLPENFGEDYHVLHINGKPATRYQSPTDAKRDMEYLTKKHPKVKLELKKVTTTVHEATYKGREVPLNKPMAGDVKKSKVYVDPDGDGKAQKVNFGDKTLSIKKNNPDRKKSYCARSGGQGNLDDKTSANYWSRKAWNCEEVDKTKPENREEGTNNLVKIYKKDTPGQSKDINEDLRKWFAQNWVRMDTKGNIKGDCAREEGEGKPKCLPAAKAQAMDKDDRAKAVRRKRREDPVADREGKGGKPVNVATESYLEEKSNPTNPTLWSKAKSLARQKFDVYPSAYANGWAAKWYKSKGGGWNSVNEEIDKSNLSNREEETEKSTKIYKKDTLGQSGNLNESFNMAFDYQGKPTLAPTAHDLMMKTQGGFAHHNDVQDVMNVKSIKEQIEKAFQATILEEDKNELAISMDNLIDMVNEAFTTIASIKSANIDRDAWSQAQILKLERYIESVAAYINNVNETVRSGETHGVIVPAHTIVSQKTGQSITIPAMTKKVKKNDVVLHPHDNPFDGK